MDDEHSRLVFVAAVVVGTPDSGVALCGLQADHGGADGAGGLLALRGGGTGAGSGCAGYLVFVRAAAVYGLWLAGRCEQLFVLSDEPFGDRIRHPFFWVARMIMLGTHFMLEVPMPDGGKRTLAEAVPFREVYIHGLIRDANREKMSKTKGNVIDPIDIINRFGTDAVRFTLASQASPGADIPLNEARTEGYRAFANKIWNAARFLFMNLDRADEAGIAVGHAVTPDAPIESRWIVSRLAETAGAGDKSLRDYRFDEAANEIYRFFWNDLCDWYLELVKLRLNFDEAADKTATGAALNTLVTVYEPALRLLSPFMPFITEEIWHALHAKLGRAVPAMSIALTRYPQAGDYPADAGAERDMTLLQDLIVTVRAVRKELQVPEKEAMPIRAVLAGSDRGSARYCKRRYAGADDPGKCRRHLSHIAQWPKLAEHAAL